MCSWLRIIACWKKETPETIQRREEEKLEDESFLLRMGYTQSLYRGFSSFMSFALDVNVISVLISITIGFSYTMQTGGSGVAIWSWIIGSIFTILIGLSLAEMCSVYPSAGAVYHWPGKLVSPRYAPVASFICGWFNFIGNTAGVATFASGFVSLLDSAFVLNGKSPLSVGSIVGIGISVTFLWAAHNILQIDQQGWINNLAVLLQMSSVVAIAIVLIVKTPRAATAKDIFTSTNNSTGFSFPYVCCIGILSTVFSFSGYEAGAHLAEETRSASRAVPRGMVSACICSAIFGLIYLLALLLAIPDVPEFMKAHGSGNETIILAVQVFKETLAHDGASALTIILICNVYLACVASMTVASRIAFAMARDDIFPFSERLRWVFESTKAPLAAVLLVFIVDSLLLLLQLVSTTAFDALLAITTIGYQISYFMPILFRCTSARHRFPVGAFSLGRFSVPIAAVSSIWLFTTSIILLFPTQYPVTKENMNYTVVIMGGIGFIASVYWFVSARHRFVGPKIPDFDPTSLPLDVINRNESTTIISESFDVTPSLT